MSLLSLFLVSPMALAFEVSGTALGTLYSVTTIAPPASQTSEQLRHQIEQIFESVNQSMSSYREQSEINRFNQNATTDWVSISTELHTLIQRAQDINKKSAGVFDITIAPLMRYYRLGPWANNDAVQNQPERDSLIIGAELLRVDRNQPQIAKTQHQLELDVGGIAKGYAIDRIAEYLDDAGYKRYLINVGGDLFARGAGPNDRCWGIAIEGTEDSEPKLQAICIRDQALATSGSYRNTVLFNDKQIAPILDPRTRQPVNHNTWSTTVIADNATNADAWATAMLVLGAEQGTLIANRQAIAVLFLDGADAATSQTIVSTEFNRMAP